jgi:hypothetical protein
MRATAFFSIVMFVILAGSGLAQAQEYKWTAQETLVSGSASFCGVVGGRREITIKNNVLVAKNEVGGAWTLPGLNKFLKSDGSGEMYGTTARFNRKYTFKFSAGTGPRPITVQSENSPCVWTWVPF